MDMGVGGRVENGTGRDRYQCCCIAVVVDNRLVARIGAD